MRKPTLRRAMLTLDRDDRGDTATETPPLSVQKKPLSHGRAFWFGFAMVVILAIAAISIVASAESRGAESHSSKGASLDLSALMGRVQTLETQLNYTSWRLRLTEAAQNDTSLRLGLAKQENAALKKILEEIDSTKAALSALQSAIEGKADATTVEAALAGKADASVLNSTEALLRATIEGKADLGTVVALRICLPTRPTNQTTRPPVTGVGFRP